jgi:integrase/recombinase XerD
VKQSCEHELSRSLPPSEWPEIDRTLWQAALRSAELLEDGGSRARHAPSSNYKVARGCGLWLDWLVGHHLLDPAAQPGSRITQERVGTYMETLRKRASTGTIINRLEDLHAALRVMDPDRDGSWIRRLISKVHAPHVPAVRKRDRIVSATDLFDLGLDLMRRASSASTVLERAVIYRDGLMISVLSTRPLRLRNLIGLELGRTFV